MEKNISSDLIRGHINTIILSSLNEGDKYGFEIIKEIEGKSEGQYELKQPTLYSSLNRLESLKYIESYWGGAVNGGRRKYFKLTESGKEIVKQNLSEWEYSRTVIDKLISDREFDLKKPAPAPIDFNLLKQSTTKIPSVLTPEQKPVNNIEAKDNPFKLVDEKILSNKKHQEERDNRLKLNNLFQNTIKTVEPILEEKKKNATLETTNKSSETGKNTKIESNKKAKPETKENDNFDLLLEDNSVGKINFSDLFEIAKQDGIKIRTCNSSDIKKTKSLYFNKGKYILFSSILIFLTSVIEIAVAFYLFGSKLSITKTEAIYSVLLFASIPVFTLFLYLLGYGKNSVKITNTKNLSASIIIMMNLFLLVCALTLVFDIKLLEKYSLIKYILIPLILLSNIPLNVIYYNSFIKKLHI